MTTDRMALVELLEKSADTRFLREMLGFVAERLMALAAEGLCGAAPGEDFVGVRVVIVGVRVVERGVR